MNKKFFFLCFIYLVIISFFTSCRKDNDIENTQQDFATGLPPKPSNYNAFPQANLPTFGTYPSTYELDMPEAGNQGSQGSCTAWAVAYGMQSYYRKHEFNLDYSNLNSRCSPSYIFNQLSNNCEGIQITSALNLLKSQGVCSIADMPFSENDCAKQPNSQQIKSALENRITNWESFNINEINEEKIKTAILANHPVVIAVNLYDGFLNPKIISGRHVWKEKGNIYKGYHAMVISGWDDSINAFKVLNSWGANFPNEDNGYIWFDYNLFDGSIIDQAYIAYNEQSNSSINFTLNPSTISFGNVNIGNSPSQQFTITNTSNSDLSITGFSNLTGYSVSPTSATITSGQQKNFTITFSPTSAVSYNGSITINSNASGTNQINVSGTGQAIKNTVIIGVSPSVINFGNINIGSNTSQIVTINNSGNATLNISSFSSTNGYSISPSSDIINSGQQKNFTITFSPTSAQSYNGNITINSNATSGTSQISVSGNGINTSNSYVPTSISPSLNSYSTIATYSCSGFGTFDGSYLRSRITNINSTTGAITFEVSRQDGQPFSSSGYIGVCKIDKCNADLNYNQYQYLQGNYTATMVYTPTPSERTGTIKYYVDAQQTTGAYIGYRYGCGSFTLVY